MGSGFNFFTNAVDKTPTTLDEWVDVDCSADIPSGSTGVILDLHAAGTAQAYVSVRKNGSTDDRSANHKLDINKHRYAWIGVDSNRVFEAKIDSAAGKIWLVGYTDNAVTFETNGIDKSLTATGAWADIDVSANAPSGSTGVIVEIINIDASTPYQGTIRKNGSTDNRVANADIAFGHCIYALCGLDASYIFEGYIENANVDFYVIGYTKAPITFFTNAIDKSLSDTAAWVDIDLTADTEASADGAIFQIYSSATTNRKGEFRKNGSTDDRTADAFIIITGHIWAGVGLDTENICEGYIGATAVDFYLMGYCKPAAGATYTKTYSADILLKKPDLNKTYSADLMLRGTLTKTYQSDVLLKGSITKTYQSDVLLKGCVTKTYQADVLLKTSLTKTYNTDVLIVAQGTKTYQADLLLKGSATKEYSADVLLKGSGVKTYNADILLQKQGLSKTYSCDVALKGVLTKTYQADVLLRKLGITKTYMVDVILGKVWTGIINSDLSMPERGMSFETKEAGMKLESLERKMKMELVAE